MELVRKVQGGLVAAGVAASGATFPANNFIRFLGSSGAYKLAREETPYLPGVDAGCFEMVDR